MGPIQTTLMVWWIFLYSRHNVYNTVRISGSYISSYDALLGHHEDEADEDGRAQHADGAHERVGPFRLLAAQSCGGGPDDHAQQSGHTGDRPEDYAGTGERVKREYLTCFKLMQPYRLQILKMEIRLNPFICTQKDAHFLFFFREVFCLELTCQCYCRPLSCRLPLSSAPPELWPSTEESTCQRHRWRRTRLRTPARRTRSSG